MAWSDPCNSSGRGGVGGSSGPPVHRGLDEVHVHTVFILRAHSTTRHEALTPPQSTAWLPAQAIRLWLSWEESA